MNPKTRMIGLTTLGLTVLATLTAVFLHPPLLKLFIAMGMPTQTLSKMPVIGNVVLSAQAPQISVQDFRVLQRSNEPFVLVDVRSDAEFNRGHIPGAVHVPIQTIEEGSGLKVIQELQQKQNAKKIVVYCHAGPRAYRAIAQMDKVGLSGVNITGGIVKWKEIVDPALPVEKP